MVALKFCSLQAAASFGFKFCSFQAMAVVRFPKSQKVNSFRCCCESSTYQTWVSSPHWVDHSGYIRLAMPFILKAKAWLQENFVPLPVPMGIVFGLYKFCG